MTTSRTRTLLRGLLSLTAILLILLGVPAVLALLGGNPLAALPGSVDEAWRAVSQPDDGTLFVALLTLIGWGVWASLAASFLIEIPAAIRGVPAPRIPGLSWQQGRAAAMTGAVAAMLAIGGATTATAATHTPAPSTTHTTSSVETAPSKATHSTAEQDSTSKASTSSDERSVTVRSGDTLWDIAQEELGDGEKYSSIARANPDTITDPDLIQPGWELTMPGASRADRDAPYTSTTQQTNKSTTAQGSSAAPDQAETSSTTTTPDRAHGQEDSAQRAVPPATPSPAGEARPSADHPSHTGAPTTTPAPAAPSTSSADQAAAVDAGDHDQLPIAATGIGALACAGLVTLLIRRRRQQDRHRTPGRRIARPTGPTLDAERVIREAADPIGVAELDGALRSLGHGASNGAHQLPTLRAARLLPDRIEVYTVEEDGDLLPRPWKRTDEIDGSGQADPGTWVLERSTLSTLQGTDHLPAPWPSLVTVGIDEEHAHVLLNLEQIGTLAVVGDQSTATDVIAGLGIELITSTWCDDAQITLVDVMPELVDALDSDRVTHAVDFDRVLNGLEHTASVFRSAFEREGATDATQARAKGVVDEAWTPHLVLTGRALTDEQNERLARVIDSTPRLAIAAITSAPVPTGTWVLEVKPGERDLPTATLAPTGMRLVPQHLTRQAFLDQLQLFDTTTHEDVPGPQWAQSITDGTPFDLADLPQPAPARAAHEHDAAEEDSLDEAATPAEQTWSPTAGFTVTDGGGYPSPTSLSATSWVTTPGAASAPDTQTPDTDAADTDVPDVDVPSAEDSSQVGATNDEQPAQDVDSQEDAAPETDDAAPQTPAQSSDDAPGMDEDTATTIRELPGASGPVVRILGNVEVVGARGPRPASIRRIAELVTFLAMRPGGDEKVFSAAIFPGEDLGPRLSHKRQTYMNTARRWLGRDDDGRPYVPDVDADGYRVTPDVTLDWLQMRDLVGEDIAATSDDDLHAALTLVTATPFSGTDPTRWDWAKDDIAEVCATVADIAHELASRSLQAGDSRRASWAVEKGLLAEPVSEALWRDLITAAWSSGVPGRARATISQARTALEPLGDDLEDETIQLINDVIAQERRHA